MFIILKINFLQLRFFCKLHCTAGKSTGIIRIKHLTLEIGDCRADPRAPQVLPELTVQYTCRLGHMRPYIKYNAVTLFSAINVFSVRMCIVNKVSRPVLLST